MTPGPPGLRFKSWGAARGLGPEALDMILGATKTDPAARLTIDQVLAHPLWQAKRPAVTPTRLFYPSSLADDATVKAANENILRFAAQNITNPQYQAFVRQCGFDMPLAWLQTNFPPASRPQSDNNGFVYCQLGTFPRDISYADKTEKEGGGADGKTSTVVTIPQDDTRLVLVGKRQGDGSAPAARIDGIKQGGVVCVALCVLPPAGLGAPGALAGTSLADKTGGTPAMKAAEQALLGFLRELQDDGYQGSDPQGEVVDGCQAIVFMGQELLVSEYSKQRGFFDPAGGYVFEKKKVPLGWPFLEESEQK